MVVHSLTILFCILITVFLFGAVGSLILYQIRNTAHIFASICAIIGSALGILFSLLVLLSHNVVDFSVATAFPLIQITIHIDMLSAFFILIIAVIAFSSAIYGIEYMMHYQNTYHIAIFDFFYNLFILSLILVVSASNAIYFLGVWEIMSLVSFFLVIFEHTKKETIFAGMLYFIMTHIGSLFILTTFILLYQYTGSFDFTVIASHIEMLPVQVQTVVFFTTLIGFGVKAGIIPMHIWLPRAHSAAPSHISALMSGVMIKMGIYMFFRMFFVIMPFHILWWGLVVLIIGAVCSLLGVLYAFTEHDIKRLLAYHSIENIGIILLGMGASMTFFALGNTALGVVAAIAALFHTMNHAIFKSLLFMAAGSVIMQTHTHDIEKYGGLIKKMGYTALFFLVGALAISGLPPFNGFVSEWLTFQGLFAGIALSSFIVKLAFVLASVSLALTGGLACACFVKAFGITFLARSRSEDSQDIHESPLLMRIGMAIPTILCIVLGFGATIVVSSLHSVVSILYPIANVAQYTIAGRQGDPATPGTTGILQMPLVYVGLALIILFVWCMVKVVSGAQKVTLTDLWTCGYQEMTPRMEVTSGGFARSLLIVFSRFIYTTKEVTLSDDLSALHMYGKKDMSVHLHSVNVYEEYIFFPLRRVIHVISEVARRIQSGNVNQYILYILLVLVGLIIFINH